MKRRVKQTMLVGAMMTLAVASTAWACASLAKVKMSDKVVQPGQTVAVTGSGFSDTHSGLAAGSSPVALRLKTRVATPLKEVDTAVGGGSILTDLTIPASLAPGYYVLLATQSKSDGTAVAGTPARYAFRVQGSPRAAGSRSRSDVVALWGNGSEPVGPAHVAALSGGGLTAGTLLGGGLLALTLLAGTAVLVARRNQTLTLST